MNAYNSSHQDQPSALDQFTVASVRSAWVTVKSVIKGSPSRLWRKSTFRSNLVAGVVEDTQSPCNDPAGVELAHKNVFASMVAVVHTPLFTGHKSDAEIQKFL